MPVRKWRQLAQFLQHVDNTTLEGSQLRQSRCFRHDLREISDSQHPADIQKNRNEVCFFGTILKFTRSKPQALDLLISTHESAWICCSPCSSGLCKLVAQSQCFPL